MKFCLKQKLEEIKFWTTFILGIFRVSIWNFEFWTVKIELSFVESFFFSSVYLLSALMPPTRRRPAILALHATRRPSRQTSSCLEASPLSSTFLAFFYWFTSFPRAQTEPKSCSASPSPAPATPHRPAADLLRPRPPRFAPHLLHSF